MSPTSDKKAKRGAPKKKRARIRDRDATKRELLDAVGRLLARDGFGAIGVNAIAREAGVDKVLLYRYFGDVDALLEAFAEESDFWPTVAELTGDLEEAYALSLEERQLRMLDNFVAAMRRRPLTHEIVAWELVERNNLTARLDEVRERRFVTALMALRAGSPPRDVDAAAVSAIVGATVNYLLVRARTTAVFSQIDIRSDAGWDRIRAALRALAMAAPPMPPPSK